MTLSSKTRIILKTFSDLETSIRSIRLSQINVGQIIARGDLEEGMNTDECRLSIGDPVEIQLKKRQSFRNLVLQRKNAGI